MSIIYKELVVVKILTLQHQIGSLDTRPIVKTATQNSTYFVEIIINALIHSIDSSNTERGLISTYRETRN